MTVVEFCLKKTQVNEFCVIRESGFISVILWIDSEDLYLISKRLANQEVKSDEWSTIPIVTEHGDKLNVPCHYIDC